MYWIFRRNIFCIVKRNLLKMAVITGLLTTSLAFIWTILHFHKTMVSIGLCQVDINFTNITVDKELLLGRLYSIQETLKQENRSKTAQRRVDNLIQLLDGVRHEISTTPEPVVCPEEWTGSKVWKMVSCSNRTPFEKVVTVLLFYQGERTRSCPQYVKSVLAGLNHVYPSMTVITAGFPSSCIPNSTSLHVREMHVKRGASPGAVWNQLAKLVTTPYVFLGRDLEDFTSTSQLERHVRMIGYNRSIGVAGGAVRNLTGHWKVGCFQASMQNYILEYVEGYHVSRNSCMFCDYLAGPFVAKTKLLHWFQFDESLPASVLFEDWFYRIRRASHNVVNCPDVMYFATDALAEVKVERRISWLPLVRKWQLNRIVLNVNHVFHYSCPEAGLTCDGISTLSRHAFTSSFIMPLCCIEQFGNALGVFHDFCQRRNLRYELNSGSVLGVVKMYDVIPWDIDGDIFTYTSNLSVYENNVAYFKERGVIVVWFRYTDDGNSYFHLDTPDINVQMFGRSQLSYDKVQWHEPFRSVPTLVLLHGHWVYTPLNPAAYARGRYGHEILSHSHSWRHVNMNDQWAQYKPGRFNRCQMPDHHACLDRFSADGNLQFKIPD